MEDIGNYLEILRRIVQRMGPYLFVELVMPGGSLLALALFLYRRRQSLRLVSARRGGVFDGPRATRGCVTGIFTTIGRNR